MDGVPGNKEALHGVIARRIRFLLDNHRMTVPEAALHLEMRATLLQEVLDQQTLPTDLFLEKIADHFGVPITFLYGGDEAASSSPDESEDELVPDLYAAPQRAGSAPSPKLTLRTVAVRHQALVELLIAKGCFTAAEYHAQIAAVEQRKA